MAKINITKPTGGEAINLISAFKSDNQIYVIFDSERMGSMGLPIVYISKYGDKLEKISDDSEWQSVKSYLKGIINGTNFEYVKIGESVNADEAYYTPLSLPQASFDLIKSRYVVEDIVSTPVLEPIPSVVTPDANSKVVEEVVTPVSPEVKVAETPVAPVDPVAVIDFNQGPVVPIEPVMPNNDVVSNMTANVSTPVLEPVNVVPTPVLEPVNVAPSPVVSEPISPVVSIQQETPTSIQDSSFIQDKETFLKACENMFDALVSKYQKKLNDLEQKEQEINMKLKSATEHLANAEAREQVANIAHDNAQKVMDISQMMPNNPNGTQTGVI